VKLADNGRRIVLGAVVDNDQLDLGIVLTEDLPDYLSEQRTPVPSWDDDRD
jgi:hypothetical protein